MYSKIMVPVDLEHIDHLQRALDVAADLGRHYGAGICYVAVTSSAPGLLGHTPEEKSERLARFAAAQGEVHGLVATSHLALSHDPKADMDNTLLGAVSETGADLVVMGSHMPGWADIFTGSHGGWMATHAKTSVMVVRDA